MALSSDIVGNKFAPEVSEVMNFNQEKYQKEGNYSFF